jgi:hypothetical protein
MSPPRCGCCTVAMAGAGQPLPASWRSLWPTVPVRMRSRRGVCSVVVLDMIVVLGALTAVGIIATPVDTSLLRRMPSAVRRGRFYYCTPPEWPAGLPLSTPAPGHVFPMLGRMLLVRLTRNWRWHRQQPRRAEPELATRIGGTGKTDYTQFQTLSSQACTTTGI